jgi:hypothetical protein
VFDLGGGGGGAGAVCRWVMLERLEKKARSLSQRLCVYDCNRVCPDSLSASKKCVVYAGLADMEDGGCWAAEIFGRLLRQLFWQLL